MTEEQRTELLRDCERCEDLAGHIGAVRDLIAGVREVAAAAITDDQLMTALYKRAEAAEERARHFARECDKLTGGRDKCTQ